MYFVNGSDTYTLCVHACGWPTASVRNGWGTEYAEACLC